MAALGAEAFLRKPFDAAVLNAAVSARLRRAEEVRLAESRRAYLSAIALLADIIEARDAYTHEHTGRVRRLALRLGERLGFSEAQLEVLGLGALLHDIGKIAVPDAILRKTGPLTRDETLAMRQHPVIGADILQRVPYLAAAAPAVRGHHERWDGAGYPDRLIGEAIPIEARIIALADAFDAITTNRPYRRARSSEMALYELRNESGKQFDPALVKIFVEHATEFL
jgi:putative nucleotidyltransferase with HDIG domain